MPTPTIYGRPGVYTNTSLIGPAPAPLTTSPSVCGLVGEHWRGPTNRAILCTSWSDFVRVFGGFQTTSTPTLANPFLAFSVYLNFLNGMQACWVQRLAASITPGSSASVTISDSQATPVGTLSFTAGMLGKVGNVGTWGNGLYVSVIAGATGRFSLAFYNGGTSPNFLVEQWQDMSMNPNDSRYVLQIINDPNAGSMYVVATNLNDAAASPANTPGAVLGQQFSGGIDCASPSPTDRAAAVTAGTSTYDQVSGVLNFAIPGEITSSVVEAAIAYGASGRPYTFFVIDPPQAQTPAGAVSYFQGLAPVSSHAAMYYPWQQANDPSSGNLRTSVLLPPSCFVLGQFAAIDTSHGVWWAPAGMKTILNGVVQPERQLSPSDQGSLNLANVNAIRSRPTGEVVIWGTRTMQTGYASLYVPVQRTLNYIEATLASLLEFNVFAPNDASTWAIVYATCNQFLGGLFSAGAFPGSTVAQSYFVLCDSTTNTPNLIEQGILTANIGVALMIPAEFIVLNVSQFQGTGATTVTTATAQ